jgi:dTDP-4-dehydrorhamnose reductase
MNKDLKILVTGVKGQLGFDCVRILKERGYRKVLGIDKDELDITDEEAVNRFVLEYKPDVIMHNAAWTAVDKAEEMPDLVYKVNVLGPKYIANAANKVGAKMFYISTDYVFDGEGTTPFEVDSPKDGLSIYGKTKSQGEDFVIGETNKYFIIRISWAFGFNGNNYIKTMLKLSKIKDELNIVCDQIGSPTYTYDLANLMADMMETDKFGVYHATNEGFCSWYDFTKYIYKAKGITNVKVNPITTEEYLKINPNQAKRPLNSRMSKSSLTKAGFNLLPKWEDAVDRYLKELGNDY